MKMLVVLGKSSPEVVGRGELNARVWDGRVVGEDAINRAVQTLRRSAVDAPPPTPFNIETVPRVGYRLSVAPIEPMSAEEAKSGKRVRRPATRTIILLCFLVVLVLAGVVAYLSLGLLHRSADGWRVQRAVNIDDLPTGAVDTALSPDGRQLAYRMPDADGRDRIAVRSVEPSGATDWVSQRGLDARRPVWSPDGKAIAFASYQADRPCRLFVSRIGGAPTPVGDCETVRDPRLAWSPDGGALLFGDAPGENGVQRITSLRLRDGERSVLTSPPANSMGDSLPIASGNSIIFQRQFNWGDEGWVSRDAATGHERVLWRRRGIAGSVAAILPDGTLVVAWTKAGSTSLDFVDVDGQIATQAVAFGPIAAMAVAGQTLMVEADRSESVLIRGGEPSPQNPPTVRGRISGPVLLPDGGLRLPAASAGISRIWQTDADGALKPWGTLSANRIAGLVLSPDGRLTSALVTGSAGREIVVMDPLGKPAFRWNPRARSVNPAAWSADGRTLIVPVLDGAGWRLFAVDPFGHSQPRDLARPGFAIVQSVGSALYAVRAGESTGGRELWRLDGTARRLPVDLTLFDIVNWHAVDSGIWLPDRSDRDHPIIVLKDSLSGRVLKKVAAPGLAGPGSGLAANPRGPIYVKLAHESPEYSVVSLNKR